MGQAGDGTAAGGAGGGDEQNRSPMHLIDFESGNLTSGPLTWTQLWGTARAPVVLYTRSGNTFTGRDGVDGGQYMFRSDLGDDELKALCARIATALRSPHAPLRRPKPPDDTRSCPAL